MHATNPKLAPSFSLSGHPKIRSPRIRAPFRWFLLIALFLWNGVERSAHAADLVVRAVAFDFDSAPGSGAPDARADGQFTSFVAPVISPNGLIAFEGSVFWPGTVSGVGAPPSRAGIWVADTANLGSALRRVMVSGMPAPGTAGDFSNGFSEVRIDSLGNVLFDASGLSGQVALGYFHADPQSVLSAVLLQNQPVSGTTNLLIGDIRLGRGFANNGYWVMNEPLVNAQQRPTGVGAFEWSGSILTTVMVNGQTEADIPMCAGCPAGTVFLGGSFVAINQHGIGLLTASTLAGQAEERGLWILDDLGLDPLVLAGDAMPGLPDFNFESFQSASINNEHIAFSAVGTNRFGEAAFALFSGAFRSVELVAGFGLETDGFFNVLVNSAGNVAFRGRTQGPGNGRDAYWIAHPNVGQTGYSVRKVVEEGMTAPDPTLGPGVTFGALPDAFAFNALDQMAFTAKLAGTGITSTNDDSLWLLDPARGLQLVAREGTDFNFQGQLFPRVVRTIRLIETGSNSQDGRPTSLNDKGQLAFSLEFHDRELWDGGRTDGLFVAEAPSCIVTNTLDSGPGSLRAAIDCANENGNTRISFNIATNDAGFNGKSFLIQPLSTLPPITNRGIVLDGGSQTTFSGNSNPSGPEIHLNGEKAPGNGLVIEAAEGGISGLVINGFTGAQLLVTGPNAMGNLISGCYIGGLGPSGDYVLNAGDSRPVRSGLVINNAPGNRIGSGEPGGGNVLTFCVTNLLISGTSATGNKVQGNIIGLDPSGTRVISTMDPENPDPNRRVVFDDCEAIVIENAPANLIGGTRAAERNVIALGFATEIVIRGRASANNIVAGNYIGLDASGLVMLGPFRGTLGCNISIEGAPGNRVGGVEERSGNLICGPHDAICISGEGSTGNIVQGNLIGTDKSGLKGLPCLRGISLGSGSSGTIIGGDTLQARNVVAESRVGILIDMSNDNIVAGNLIGTDVTGKATFPSRQGVVLLASTNNLIGGHAPGQGNVISGSTGTGVDISFGATNVIAGNLIGTDLQGEMALPNSIGVKIFNSSGNLIGGNGPRDRNVISGNLSHGIVIDAGPNRMEGNVVGLNSLGTAALRNGGHGIYVTGASNVIGGSLAGSANTISGNGENGILIEGIRGAAQTILGNRIGTDLSGEKPIPNELNGILITNSPNNLVGGFPPNDQNVISANGDAGVAIGGNASTNNQVINNVIGLDASGNIRLGNGGAGIALHHAPSNRLAANFIGDNRRDGILIAGVASIDNVVTDNDIGSDLTGVPRRGNAFDGIHLDAAASTEITRNIVLYNGQNGVGIAAGTSNLIQENRISENGQLGIDLGGDGVTLNDPGDLDVGANLKANTPELLYASWGNNGPLLQGRLEALPRTAYAVEFYANSSCDPSGYGEGELFQETLNLTTDNFGQALFVHRLKAPVAPGTFLTASATDPAGNSSEFSRCVTVDIVTNGVDLAVSLVPTPQPAYIDQPLVARIVVTNQGLISATGIVLTNLLPAGAEFVQIDPGPGNICVYTNQVLSCILSSLVPGRSHAITLTLRPQVAGMLTNEVMVDAIAIDQNPADNRLTTPLAVEQSAAGPVIQIVQQQGTVLLSWNSPNEFRVESSPRLGSEAVWTLITNQVSANANLHTVVIPVGPGNIFLRLR